MAILNDLLVNGISRFVGSITADEIRGLGANYYGVCDTAAATAAKVVTCEGFVLKTGVRISVKFTNGSTSSSNMTLDVNGTGAKTCGVYLYNNTWQALTNRCDSNTVLEFMYNGTYWIVLTPYTLRNFGTYSARITSANRSFPNFGLEYFLATSSMTTGKPPTDAHILNFNWDNGTTHTAQLAIGHGTTGVIAGRLFTRGQPDSSTWSSWLEVPRLSGALTNNQIVVSDESTGTALLKGGPTIGTGTTKFLREDGTWQVPSGTGTITGGGITGYLAQWTGASGQTSTELTAGPAFGTGTTTYLRNDGTWAVPQASLAVLTYGTSTWNDFITAYNNNAIVYCAVDVSGSKRMAFLAYYDNVNPDAEFQYVRSVGSLSSSNPSDQVFIYKLYSDNSWTTTTRSLHGKIAAGTAITVTPSSDAVTVAHTDTSTQASVTNSGHTYIQSVTLDGMGHVTGLTSATESGGGGGGGTTYVYRGTCETAAATAEKAVTCSEFTSDKLVTGATIFVTFTATNSAAVGSIALNVNGTGAKNIKYLGNAAVYNLPSAGYIIANMTYCFVYNGTYWVMDLYYNTNDQAFQVRPYYMNRLTSQEITSYKVMLLDKDGKYIPYATTSGATTYTKTINTTAFNPFAGIFWKLADSTTTANTKVGDGQVYYCQTSGYGDVRYSFNINSSGTAGTTALTSNTPIFIKAKYDFSTGLATLVPNSSSSNYLERSSIVQALPTTNPNDSSNFYIYIYFGNAYDKYRSVLSLVNEVYAWNSISNSIAPFTGAPFSGSGTFSLMDSGAQYGVSGTYYKNGKTVTIYGSFPTGSTAITSLPGLPFAPTNSFEVMLPQYSMTSLTIVQCKLGFTAGSTSVTTTGYVYGMSSSNASWINYSGRTALPFMVTYVTNE